MGGQTRLHPSPRSPAPSGTDSPTSTGGAAHESVRAVRRLCVPGACESACLHVCAGFGERRHAPLFAY